MADGFLAAYAAAVRLLAQRARSEAQLRTRLARRDFEREVIDRVVARLRQERYLDDVAFAEQLVRARVTRQPRSTTALLRELAEKGVASATAGAAVERVLADEALDERALAERAAEAWARRRLPPRSAVPDRDGVLRLRRRLHAHLERRGFRGEAAIAAERSVIGRWREA
ncbi:MAG: regulatory protein RecX [Longimicrobiales bacterium]